MATIDNALIRTVSEGAERLATAIARVKDTPGGTDTALALARDFRADLAGTVAGTTDFTEGLIRARQALAVVADTPAGVKLTEECGLEEQDLFDLTVPQIVLARMIGVAAGTVTDKARRAVLEELVGEESVVSEIQLTELFSRMRDIGLPQEQAAELAECFARELLAYVFNEKFQSRRTKDEAPPVSLMSDCGLETTALIAGAGHDFLFQNLPPQANKVLSALSATDPALYEKVVKVLIRLITEQQTGKIPRKHSLSGYISRTTELEELIKQLLRESTGEAGGRPADIRRQIREELERLGAAAPREIAGRRLALKAGRTFAAKPAAESVGTTVAAASGEGEPDLQAENGDDEELFSDRKWDEPAPAAPDANGAAVAESPRSRDDEAPDEDEDKKDSGVEI